MGQENLQKAQYAVKKIIFHDASIKSNGIFHPIGVRGDKIEIETLILVMN